MSEMVKGSVVEIYRDPLTKERFEGRAELIYLQESNCGMYEGRPLQRWLVRFEGELRQYSRAVLADEEEI